MIFRYKQKHNASIGHTRFNNEADNVKFSEIIKEEVIESYFSELKSQ